MVEYLEKNFKYIESNINEARKVTDPRISAMLSCYLVVLICGIYEDCIERLIIQKSKENGGIEMENFATYFVDRELRTPKFDKVKGLILVFNEKYRDELDKIESKSISAWNSIVNDRQNIAHGNPYSINIGLNDVISYYQDSKKIFAVLEKVLLTNNE